MGSLWDIKRVKERQRNSLNKNFTIPKKLINMIVIRADNTYENPSSENYTYSLICRSIIQRFSEMIVGRSRDPRAASLGETEIVCVTLNSVEWFRYAVRCGGRKSPASALLAGP